MIIGSTVAAQFGHKKPRPSKGDEAINPAIPPRLTLTRPLGQGKAPKRALQPCILITKDEVGQVYFGRAYIRRLNPVWLPAQG